MDQIIIRLSGGIGNQLFAYAAAKRLSTIYNAELIIDPISGFRRDYKYQRKYELGHFNHQTRMLNYDDHEKPFLIIKHFLIKNINKFIPFNRRSFYSFMSLEFDDRLFTTELKSKLATIEGYWQSELYFKEIEHVLRRDLEFIPPVDELNIKFSESIQSSQSVSIHVRYFDSKFQKSNLGSDYYDKAIRYIKNKIFNPHFYIFSNDPVRAEKLLNLPANSYTIIKHNTQPDKNFADLWLMSLCKNHIIANSTFSWWGAWLSMHPDKIVVAPGFKFPEGEGAWGFEKLLPMDWIVL